ncbi:MAG: hypothetical protein FK734_13980 [Asgard group archaeon]|nr:hypothetical protein [Asgard group archaeon]
MSKVTADMLKKKLVIDANDIKVGIVKDIIREQYNKIAVDFLEIELDKKVPLGFKDKVKVRARDAQITKDGNIKVNFTKEQLKTMSKEQELQRHPPTI